MNVASVTADMDFHSTEENRGRRREALEGLTVGL
jgi:hypothetical protein